MRVERREGPWREGGAAYHVVRWDDQLGDFEVIEYDRDGRMLGRQVVRHPREGETGENVHYDAEGRALSRVSLRPVAHRPVRLRRGMYAGRIGTVVEAVRDERTAKTRYRVDVRFDDRTASTFVDPDDVEPASG